MESAKRRNFTPEEKGRILRRHLLDLVDGVEALRQQAGYEWLTSAEYPRNFLCPQAQQDAIPCKLEADQTASDDGDGTKGKGLPPRELASPDKEIQECSKSIPDNDLWWRERRPTAKQSQSPRSS